MMTTQLDAAHEIEFYHSCVGRLPDIACLGQPAPAAPGPQDVCQRLAAFLQERGGRIDKPLAAPITLDEVNRFMERKNVRACREAISIMQTSGVDVPASLLDTIGSTSPTSQNAGTRK